MPTEKSEHVVLKKDRLRAFEAVETRLAATDATAASSLSTNVTDAAPRDRASIPRAPVPANRSTTRIPFRSTRLPRMSKIDSRTRSDVGLTPSGTGAPSRRPRLVPPTTRLDLHRSRSALLEERRVLTQEEPELVCELGILLERGVLFQESLCDLAGVLHEAAVGGTERR